MNVNKVMRLLEKKSDERRKSIYMKKGADENTLGVLRGDIRKLADEIGTNHQLAYDLWAQNVTEARLLSLMILEPQELTKEQLQRMAEELSYDELLDRFTTLVVLKTDYADELATKWIYSHNDNLGRLGWNIVTQRLSKKNIDENVVEETLDYIEKNLVNATPKTQWAMNSALATIGFTYPEYTSRSLYIAERLGVYKDYKVPKNCVSPYAVKWINHMNNKKKSQ